MQTEPTRSDAQTGATNTDTTTVCPNCRVHMPRELRFCRSCGFRLGEGVAEFTETVRFDKAAPGKEQAKTATSAPRQAATASSTKWHAWGNMNEWGGLAVGVSQNAVKSAAKHFECQAQKQQPEKKQKQQRSQWIGWLIAIIIFSVISSGGFRRLSGLRDSFRGSTSSSSSASRSWVGTSAFKNSDKGVTFEKVEPQGSPADKAGLVGGDLVVTFDGKPVKISDEFRKLLAAPPIGKTVEVVYIRDGETKTTQLTTASKDEIERLEETADDRTRGYVGIGNSYEQVSVPGTNITGVQLNSIRRNNPAYIAGMRDGDIVIEFDGVPIRTYDELESRTRRAVPDSTVKVVVMRGQERLEIPVKVGVDD